MLKKRNLLFLSILVLAALFLTSCFLNPPATEGIFKGQVMVPEGTLKAKDLTGQAFPDATVNIIDLATGAIIATTVTDSDGYYQVSVPPGGPYLLEAVKGSVKLEQITCPVEVGIEYDLGTADCTTTAAALIAQAMMDAGDNPADIDCAAIIADPNFDDVSSIVCSTIKAGGDPTTSSVVNQAVEDFLNPPPTCYTITASAGTGGNIDPVGNIKIKVGTNKTFNITSLLCFQIADVLVDGTSVGPVDTYTFQDVQQNHTIQVNFVESGLGIYNIDKDQNYQTIQEAILSATDGETIVVCPGIYNENIVFDGKNITVRSVDPSDSTIVAATVIDGGGNDSVVQFNNSDTSTLEGFTICNGNGGDGGIYIDNSSPNIQNNIISNNWAKVCGGGISVWNNSSPTISNNTISDNVASEISGIYQDFCYGGGIYVNGSSPIITQNIITRNTSLFGGGIVSILGSPIISDNTITVNTAGYGGGIYLDFSSSTIKNNVISDNMAMLGEGGGIFVLLIAPTILPGNTITGNTITGNTSVVLGGGIFVSQNCNLLPETIGRPDGWGTDRINIPTGDPLVPAEGEVYSIAGNEFLGNEHGDPLDYSEGVHVYFQ